MGMLRSYVVACLDLSDKLYFGYVWLFWFFPSADLIFCCDTLHACNGIWWYVAGSHVGQVVDTNLGT